MQSHYPLRFCLTAPYPCSYLPDAVARSQVATPGELVDTQVYSQLVDQGFRRSGLFTYRPQCMGCQKCQTLRVPVERFAPNRSQRRTWQQHRQLSTALLPARMDNAHFALYQRYLRARHDDGGMDNDSPADYEQFLLHSRVKTCLLEFRDGEASQGEAQAPLRMVSVVDVLDQGLSAVYTFYDPDVAGLGTYAILWLIEWARQLGLPYVYLGYWIEDSTKMAYKARFLPHEVLQDGRWVEVDRR